MTVGALVVFLTYLGKLFRPIQDLARATTNIAQTTVGLEHGRLVERGTHDALLAQHGLFAQLYQQQGHEDAHAVATLQPSGA